MSSLGFAGLDGYYFEDFSIGQRFSSGSHMVNSEEIKRFARTWDPQPFHLDEEEAARTIFGGLAASGWHTAAITMGLVVRGEFRPVNGILGLGVEDLRWPAAVRPGDTLRVVSEVVEVRPSISKPDYGVVKVRNTTTNQEDEPVQVFTAILLVARRPGEDHGA
jgi:acyl dehydratase